MKFRVKQIGYKFYPQYKKWFIGWGYYEGSPYLDYGAVSFLTAEKIIFHEELYFDSFEDANKFLIEEKNKKIKKILPTEG